MSTPCAQDEDLVERLVQRIATLTGQPVQVVRVAEGIAEREYRCPQCTWPYVSQVAADECAAMDLTEQRSRR